MDFLKDVIKEIGDDYATVANKIDDTERTIDTGSHTVSYTHLTLPTIYSV